MLRPVNPTDALALLPLQMRAMPNEARVGAALGKMPARLLPIGSLAAEWFPRRRLRHAWVLSRRGIPVGVVGVRMRTGDSCWEIDSLHVARNREEDAADLLEEVGAATGFLGGHRLLLRLSASSRLDVEARSACFNVCSTEDLYYRPSGPHTPAPSASGSSTVRPASSEDMYDMFRVHMRSTPGAVRQAEGLTFSQWSDARERGAAPPSRRMLAYESAGELVGYAATVPAGGRTLVDIVTPPDASEVFDRILDAILVSLGQRTDLLFLVSSHRPDISGQIERPGFRQIDELRLYVKYITARVSQPELVAVGA